MLGITTCWMILVVMLSVLVSMRYDKNVAAFMGGRYGWLFSKRLL